MNVKPFHFNLKKISSKQQGIVDAVMSFLPKSGLRNNLHAAINEVLAKHLGEDASYSLESISHIPYRTFAAKLAEKPLVCLLNCAPLEKKAFFEMDAVLAEKSLERLLGGNLNGSPMPRNLTDIEQGVLQYLILQFLSHIHRLCGNKTRVVFRFDKFVFEQKEMYELQPDGENVVVLLLKVNLGETSAYARLALPDPLVQEAFLNFPESRKISEEEISENLDEMKNFGSLKLVLWAEAGRTTLTPAELNELERDDVILFDECDAVISKDGSVSGRVALRIGLGLHGGFFAEASSEKRKLLCRIEQQIRGEEI